MPVVASTLSALVVVSTVAGLVGVLGGRRTPKPDAGAQRSSPLRHPGCWLLVVVALLYANQVLVTIYVLRIHHGDTSFVTGYLPPGWFDLADDNAAVVWLAARFPAPELLGWSVLRIPALLELPFVVLAYLTICRWFGPEQFLRAARRVWAASVAYTIAFCLIELVFANPFTVDDILLRCLSAVLVPLGVSKLAAGSTDATRSPVGFGLFALSTACVGFLTLAVYDTALLYNLGRLSAHLPAMLAATAVLAAARFAAGRLREPGAPGPGFETMSRSFGWFLVLFFVPALPLRYGFSFGALVPAVVAGIAIAAVAVHSATREVAERRSRSRRSLAFRFGLAAGAGLLGGLAASLAVQGSYEANLLAAGAGATAVAVAVCLLLDRRPEAASQRPDQRNRRTHL